MRVIGSENIAVEFHGMATGRFDLNRHMTDAELTRDEAPDPSQNRFGRVAFVNQYMAGERGKTSV
jgi:hypothetical protein